MFFNPIKHSFNIFQILIYADFNDLKTYIDFSFKMIPHWTNYPRTTRYKKRQKKKKKLEGGKGMESAENSSFKGKRQENILMKKRNIGVILLLQIYTIYLLVSHYLLLVKNKQKPLAKSKRPIRLVSD